MQVYHAVPTRYLHPATWNLPTHASLLIHIFLREKPFADALTIRFLPILSVYHSRCRYDVIMTLGARFFFSRHTTSVYDSASFRTNPVEYVQQGLGTSQINIRGVKNPTAQGHHGRPRCRGPHGASLLHIQLRNQHRTPLGEV